MKTKQIKELKNERANYRLLRSKLTQFASKVMRDELPRSLSGKRKEQIEFHIIELRELLKNCDIGLESMIDDLINE